MRFFVTFVILLLGALAYLIHLNPAPVVFRVTQTRSVELGLSVLLLGAIAFGGMLVLSALGMRELRRWWANWRVGRQRQVSGKVQEHLALAHRAWFSGRAKEAVSHLGRVLDINPNHVPALLLLGTIKNQAGERDDAIRFHRRARAADDQNIEVALALGQALEAADRADDAVQVYRDVLKTDEQNPAVTARLRDLYLKLERWEDAHGLQERILGAAKAPADAAVAKRILCGIKYELGRMWTAKGDRDRARRAFRGAVKLDQRFVPAYVGWGELIIQEGRPRDAAALYEKAYQSVPDIILLHRLEDLYIDMGEPEQILRCYHEAVRKDPDSHALRFYLGKLYYRLEMLEEAQDVLSGIDASDEHFPDLHRLLGNLAERQGNDAAAIDEFKRAMGLKQRVIVPYYCPVCDYHSTKYSGRCPRCKTWNTLSALPIVVKQKTERVITRMPW
ncbi:MAG TPA: tetratricopeptide repeat protein [Nitrospiria bacterium]|nr:tetratricopeptide repeat protein [Nitrospiria bacterium]